MATSDHTPAVWVHSWMPSVASATNIVLGSTKKKAYVSGAPAEVIPLRIVPVGVAAVGRAGRELCNAQTRRTLIRGSEQLSHASRRNGCGHDGECSKIRADNCACATGTGGRVDDPLGSRHPDRVPSSDVAPRVLLPLRRLSWSMC